MIRYLQFSSNCKKTYQIPTLHTEVLGGPKGPGRPRTKPREDTWSVNVEDELLLVISVMMTNKTKVPKGICPILLVFGAKPKMPILDTWPGDVPQADCMVMLKTAEEENIDLMTKIRLKQSKKDFILSRPKLSQRYGDRVLVFRKTVKRWETQKFFSRNERTILITEPSEDIQLYPMAKVSELKEGVYLPRPDIYEIDRDEKKNSTRQTKSTSVLPTAKHRLFQTQAKKRKVLRRPFW